MCCRFISNIPAFFGALFILIFCFSLVLTENLGYNTDVKQSANDPSGINPAKRVGDEARFQLQDSGAQKANLHAAESRNPPEPTGHVEFFHGFLPTIYVILISEIGDKTFFIAAIMSIRNSRCVVYAGAMSALATMTILSALMGYATTIISRKLTWFLSGLLFAVFGLKMLNDGYHMSADEAQEEYNEVKEDLRRRDLDYVEENRLVVADPESGLMAPQSTLSASSSPSLLPIPSSQVTSTKSTSHCAAFQRLFYALLSKVFVEAFILTFLAEWGDRSQISTIVLAATKDVVGVIVGGVLGHAMCTGMAVVCGRIVSQKIPVRWLTIAGGVTFLLFSVHTFYLGPDQLS